MRLFEFRDGEVDNNTRLTIDLDYIEMLQATPYNDSLLCTVVLVSGMQISVTKPAFDRVMQAWKSR